MFLGQPLTSLVAQNANVVDLQNGPLSSRACSLSHPAVEPYFHVNTKHTPLRLSIFNFMASEAYV